MRIFARIAMPALLVGSGVVLGAVQTIDASPRPEAPCSPTSGYTCTSPSTTVPLTPEGTCVMIGLDTELADPTFIDPSTDRIIGITMFVQYNPTSASTALCPLRLDRENAEQMYDLIGSMLAEGIEVEDSAP